MEGLKLRTHLGPKTRSAMAKTTRTMKPAGILPGLSSLFWFRGSRGILGHSKSTH